MAVPTSALQGLTNKSIIELFSVELKADVHYSKTTFDASYIQINNEITFFGLNLTLTAPPFNIGSSFNFNFITGDAISDIYTVKTIDFDANSFTVTSTISQSTGGLVTFNINTSITDPTVYLFHAGNNMKDNLDIVWQSNKYTRMPVKADGFKYSGEGKLPRPTLTFSNVLGTITSILQLTNQITPFSDLSGAKVTRRRTLARFLDEENFPSNSNPYKVGNVDPTAEMPREIYFIERKTIENRDIVQFELVSSFDLFGISAPKKLVTKTDFAGVGTFVNF